MTYQLGETIRFTATITDSDEAAADPTTVTISIRNPVGTMVVTDQTMTNPSVGSYYYDYTTLSAGVEGMYTVEVTATGSAGRVTIELDTFIAEESI